MSENKEQQIRLAMIAICVLLCFLLWQFGEAAYGKTEKLYQGRYQVRMYDAPVLPAKVERLMQDNRTEIYNFWSQKGFIRLENPDLRKSAVGDVIYYYGDYTLQFSLILENGCAVPEDIAYELWGTLDIIGEPFLIAEKEYVVEQIIAERQPVVAKLTAKSEIPLDVLDIFLTEESDLFYTPSSILIVNQLEENIIFSFDGILSACRNLRVIPIWIFAIVAAIRFFRKGWNLRKERVRGLAHMTVGLLWPCICAVVFGIPFGIPQSFIPTKWSDFSFWSNAFQQQHDNLTALNEMRLYLPDQQIINLLLSLLCSGMVMAGLLYLAGLNLWKLIGKGGYENGIRAVREYCKNLWKRCGGSKGF